MKIILFPPWKLDTEDSAAINSGEPVFVNEKSGEAFCSTDHVEAFTAWGRMSAAQTVRRMARNKKFRDDELRLIKRFTKHH